MEQTEKNGQTILFRAKDYNTYEWSITLHIGDARKYIKYIIDFLCFFMCPTLAKRLVASVLLVVGAPYKLLEDLGICCVRSGGTYARLIKEGKIQELFTIKSGGGRPAFYEAGEFEAKIRALLDSRSFYCLVDIKKALKEEFNLNPSLSALRYNLKKWGYRRLKCGSLPAKADVAKQRDFYDNTLHPLMEEAKAGKCHLLFMDAAHFVFGCGFIGAIYARTRRFIRTCNGRNRYNVLGAIDYETKEVLTVTNTKYITATQIIKMMSKMQKKYKADGLPIKVILDNARYQKCAAVTEAAVTYNIDLVYLPSYSPNLNLIERLWKYVKTDVRSNILNIDSFDAFMAHIDKTLAETATTRKDKISNLIGEKVQLFDEVTIAA